VADSFTHVSAQKLCYNNLTIFNIHIAAMHEIFINISRHTRRVKAMWIDVMGYTRFYVRSTAWHYELKYRLVLFYFMKNICKYLPALHNIRISLVNESQSPRSSDCISLAKYFVQLF